MVKIHIAADMEGISGVTNWNQVTQGQMEYARFRKIMTEDVNAAIRGAFEGGAKQVVVTDGHGGGSNILIEDLDARARLNAGHASPFAMVQGVQSGDFDGVIFVGYHARNGSQEGVLAHTWSSLRIANVWLNDVLMGECGLNAALCGHFGTPVLMITGDQTVCTQAMSLLGEIETVEVKQATSFQSAECLPPAVAQEMIQRAAVRAVVRLAAGEAPKPLKVQEPVKGMVEFRLVEMADSASRLPGAIRLDGTRIAFSAPDMPEAYMSFRALV
ncbi:MAG: M55 family metallopeptidase, partial [Anaerolineales bacterium]|nr:M55 family metallopeptidase [Anaerolineales bacterium]